MSNEILAGDDTHFNTLDNLFELPAFKQAAQGGIFQHFITNLIIECQKQGDKDRPLTIPLILLIPTLIFKAFPNPNFADYTKTAFTYMLDARVQKSFN